MNDLVPFESIVESKGSMRQKILQFEERLALIPGAGFGDQVSCPLKHSFADGVYVREIFIPKGTLLTGKIHRHSHPNFLMKGEVSVVTENGGTERLKAPMAIISPAGTKRIVFAHEDTVWITVHSNETDTTDLLELEKEIISPSFQEYEEFKRNNQNETGFVIYRIQNTVNSKIYIGCSSSIKNRWKVHAWRLNRNIHCNKKLQNAWNKHGKESFIFSILEHVPSEKDLISREQAWLDMVNPEYNICKIAGRTNGIKQSKEQRMRTSERMLGNKYASGKARIQTQETRKKISASLIGRRHSDESYARQASKITGRKLSLEARKKLSDSQSKRRSLERGMLCPG